MSESGRRRGDARAGAHWLAARYSPLAVSVALLVSAGCSNSSIPRAASTSAPGRAAATPASASDDASSAAAAAALTAYRGMWRDWVTAARTSDYQSSLLPQHAAGQALSLISQSLYQNRRAGVVTTGQPHLDPRALPATGDSPAQIEIVDCVDTRDWLNHTAATGKLDDPNGGSLRRFKATAQREQSTWKVTRLFVGDPSSC